MSDNPTVRIIIETSDLAADTESSALDLALSWVALAVNEGAFVPDRVVVEMVEP
jgi:hypothetical protein